MCRGAANTLNKQLRTTDEGWSSSLGIGLEDKTPHRKYTLLRNFTQPLGIGGLF
jgi:hypothetical protein